MNGKGREKRDATPHMEMEARKKNQLMQDNFGRAGVIAEFIFRLMLNAYIAFEPTMRIQG
jgi:hypothetical protein